MPAPPSLERRAVASVARRRRRRPPRRRAVVELAQAGGVGRAVLVDLARVPHLGAGLGQPINALMKGSGFQGQ